MVCCYLNDSVSNHLSQHRPGAHPLGETESQLCNAEFLRRQIKQNKQQITHNADVQFDVWVF